jgi:P-type Ca2+ transporter type 2C
LKKKVQTFPKEKKCKIHFFGNFSFGENVYPQAPGEWWINLFFGALFGDSMLIILMVVAVISMVLGIAFPEHEEERPFG